ncbi:hypothetical protein QFZ74_003682 [Streptomyces sp. V3I7]|nr:hypothetical protein [Streptomyces sp. V3I7]
MKGGHPVWGGRPSAFALRDAGYGMPNSKMM